METKDQGSDSSENECPPEYYRKFKKNYKKFIRRKKSKQRKRKHSRRGGSSSSESWSSDSSSSSSDDNRPPPKKSKSIKEREKCHSPQKVSKPLSKSTIAEQPTKPLPAVEQRGVEKKSLHKKKRRNSRSSSREKVRETVQDPYEATEELSELPPPQLPPEVYYQPRSPLPNIDYQECPTPSYSPDGKFDTSYECRDEKNKNEEARTVAVDKTKFNFEVINDKVKENLTNFVLDSGEEEEEKKKADVEDGEIVECSVEKLNLLKQSKKEATSDVVLERNKRSVRNPQQKNRNLASKCNINGILAIPYTENNACENCAFQVSHSCKDFHVSRMVPPYKSQCRILTFSSTRREIVCRICLSWFKHPKCFMKITPEKSEAHPKMYTTATLVFWTCNDSGCGGKIWHTGSNDEYCNILKCKESDKDLIRCACEYLEVKHVCQEEVLSCEIPIESI